jgi:ribosomal protein S21
MKTTIMNFRKKPKDYGTTVYMHNHKTVEELIRRFKKRVTNSGILELYRKKMYYIKPSVKKRQIKKVRDYNAKRISK